MYIYTKTHTIIQHAYVVLRDRYVTLFLYGYTFTEFLFKLFLYAQMKEKKEHDFRIGIHEDIIFNDKSSFCNTFFLVVAGVSFH